jgi:hypothetical protein
MKYNNLNEVKSEKINKKLIKIKDNKILKESPSTNKTMKISDFDKRNSS